MFVLLVCQRCVQWHGPVVLVVPFLFGPLHKFRRTTDQFSIAEDYGLVVERPGFSFQFLRKEEAGILQDLHAECLESTSQLNRASESPVRHVHWRVSTPQISPQIILHRSTFFLSSKNMTQSNSSIPFISGSGNRSGVFKCRS